MIAPGVMEPNVGKATTAASRKIEGSGVKAAPPMPSGANVSAAKGNAAAAKA